MTAISPNRVNYFLQIFFLKTFVQYVTVWLVWVYGLIKIWAKMSIFFYGEEKTYKSGPKMDTL